MKTIHQQISDTVTSMGVANNEIDLQAHFSADLGLDSLDLAYLVTLWEAEFEIDIPDSALYQFIKVGDVVQYIHTKLYVLEEPTYKNTMYFG